MQESGILIEIRCVRGHFVAFKGFPAFKARHRPREYDFRNLLEKTVQDSGILVEIRCVRGHFVAIRRSPARPLLTGVVGGVWRRTGATAPDGCVVGGGLPLPK